MPLKDAMRLDRPKKAVMAEMSQASSSSKPWACRVAKFESLIWSDCEHTFIATSITSTSLYSTTQFPQVEGCDGQMQTPPMLLQSEGLPAYPRWGQSWDQASAVT